MNSQNKIIASILVALIMTILTSYGICYSYGFTFSTVLFILLNGILIGLLGVLTLYTMKLMYLGLTKLLNKINPKGR